MLITSPTNLDVPAVYPTIKSALETIQAWSFIGAGAAIVRLDDGAYLHNEAVLFNHPQANRITLKSMRGLVSPLFNSVVSVTGSSGNWEVTYSISGGAIATTDMLARFAGVTGRRAFILNGRMKTVSGNATITGFDTRFLDGDTGFVEQTTGIPMTKLIVGNEILTLDGNPSSHTSLSVTSSPSGSNDSAMGIACNGNAVRSGTIQVTGANVYGSGTSFLSELAPNDIIMYTDDPSSSGFHAAFSVEVDQIISDNHLTLKKAPTVDSNSGRKFCVHTSYLQHAGAHEILSVSDTLLKVKNKSLSRPSHVGILDIKIRIPRASIKMTADYSAVEVSMGCSGAVIENVGFMGTGSGVIDAVHGISLGRVQSSSTIIQGLSGIIMTGSNPILNFAGSGISARNGSVVSADFACVSGCLNGVCSAMGSYIQARAAIFTGNTSTGATLPIGASANLEESVFAGNNRGLYQGSGSVHLSYSQFDRNTGDSIQQDGGSIDCLNNVTMIGSGTTHIRQTGGSVSGASVVIQNAEVHGVHSFGGGVALKYSPTNSNGFDGMRAEQAGYVLNTQGYSCSNGRHNRYAANRGYIHSHQGRTYYGGGFGLCAENGGRITQTSGASAANVSGNYSADGGVPNSISPKGSYIQTT